MYNVALSLRTFDPLVKLNSDCVNLFAPASAIEGLLYLPNVRAIQYKLGPEKLTRLGNSNILRLPVLFNPDSSLDHVALQDHSELLNLSSSIYSDITSYHWWI